MKYLLCIISTLFLTACSLDTTTRTLSVLESTTNLKYYYEKDEQIINQLTSIQLTEAESIQLNEAVDQIVRSINYLSKYEDNPEMIVLNIKDIAFQYAKLKSAYLSIKDIALSNKDKYDDQTWQMFVEIDSATAILDQQLKDLVESAESNAALMTAIRFGNVAIKLSTLL